MRSLKRLGHIATRLLEQDESASNDEEYQPLQEIIQLALWENLDPALGIRVMLAAQGTCNAVTAYEQSIAGTSSGTTRTCCLNNGATSS